MPGPSLAMFHPAFRTFGGADLLAAHQARFLAGRGYRVDAVTFDWDAPRWREALEGIPVRLVPKRRPLDLLEGFGKLAKIRARGARAAKALQPYSLVMAHNHPCSAMLGHMRLDAARLWYCHEPRRSLYLREANPTLASRAGRTAEAWALQGFDPGPGDRATQAHDREGVLALEGILANSAFTSANLQRIYGRPADAVIPPMIRFPAARLTARGLRGPGLQILVQSRLGRLKNLDTVLRGFARFAGAFPESRLHVVGEGEARAELEALASELGQGRIRFHGFLEAASLDALRGACDAFVLLPADEPFGMVFPEAAGAGLLVIGPDHGGPVEILEGGALGACVDAFDPEALADALARLASMPGAEVEALRERADAACRARYSEPVVGAALEAFLGRY